MLSYVTESPVILDRPLSRTTLFVSSLYTSPNKNVKQSMRVLHTDSFISHTFGKWPKLVILFIPCRITDDNHLLPYIVSQKLKKVNPNFLYFSRNTMYLYYITQSSVLCNWNCASSRRSKPDFFPNKYKSDISIIISAQATAQKIPEPLPDYTVVHPSPRSYPQTFSLRLYYWTGRYSASKSSFALLHQTP